MELVCGENQLKITEHLQASAEKGGVKRHQNVRGGGIIFDLNSHDRTEGVVSKLGSMRFDVSTFQPVNLDWLASAWIPRALGVHLNGKIRVYLLPHTLGECR